MIITFMILVTVAYIYDEIPNTYDMISSLTFMITMPSIMTTSDFPSSSTSPL